MAQAIGLLFEHDHELVSAPVEVLLSFLFLFYHRTSLKRLGMFHQQEHHGDDTELKWEAARAIVRIDPT